VFFDQNHIDELKGIYVPFWLYDGVESYQGDFNATKVRTWSDSNYNYTETSHYHVRRTGTEKFVNVPVDGSKEMPDDLMESLEPFDTGKMVPFNMGYLAGFLANKYNVTAEENHDRAVKRMNASVSADFRNTIVGYNSYNAISENSSISDEKVKYVLFPVYVLNTSWNGGNYLFAMNGQTGKFIGNLPFSISQALKYYIPIAGVVAAISYALMATF
jgi:hypothetical protein